MTNDVDGSAASDCYANGAASLLLMGSMSVDWMQIASAIKHVAGCQLSITEAVLRVKYHTKCEEVEEIRITEGTGWPANEGWLDVQIPATLIDEADAIVSFVLFCEDDYEHVNILVKRVVHRGDA